MSGRLRFEDVERVCARREIEITFGAPRAGYQLTLIGGYEGLSEFFEICARGIGYVDLACDRVVGSIRLVSAFPRVEPLLAKWAQPAAYCDAPALVIDTVDDGLPGNHHVESYVLVAEEIAFWKARDWSRVAELARE